MSVFDYFEKAKELLDFIGKNQKNISIVIHKNPDGDALGAALAMSLWLQKNGHSTKVIAPNYFSENFAWLPSAIDIVVYESLFKNTVVEYIQRSDIVLCIDFSQKSRIDQSLNEVIEKHQCKVGVIDHHLDDPELGDFVCWNSKVASTCELIYEMMNNMETDTIDDNIATCLYTGIVTDTGRFMTANMTYRVHEIAADLLKKHNIDIQSVNKFVYGSNRLSKLRFVGYVLSRCLKTVNGYNVAYITISQEDIMRFVVRPGDTDGLVNYALSVKGVVVAALFNEKKDGIYISLRSVGDFSVNDLAKQHFGGGGHKNASGGISKLTLVETITSFIDIIKGYDELKSL